VIDFEYLLALDFAIALIVVVAGLFGFVSEQLMPGAQYQSWQKLLW
jgi:hypothetical protein